MRVIDFDTWKAEYEPRVYQDSGAWCYDHNGDCDCEFLYTVELSELTEEEEDFNAEEEQRLWTWHEDGTIVSGIHDKRAALLITKKPWHEATTAQ
jgi:hypothetical protein